MNKELLTPSNSKESPFGLYVFIFSFFAAIFFLFFMSFFYPGVDLPQGIGGASSQEKVGASAFNLGAVKESWFFSQEMSEEGQKIYNTNCAFCHGDKGLGDGVAGKGLQPPPRNLVEGDWKYGGDSISLYKSITKGVPDTSMASYSSLSPAERWSLVHFIRSITQNKIEDKKEELSAFGKEAN